MFMLAKPLKSQPVAGWLASEKLDGVRAWWDGQKFISRGGAQFVAPQWFVAQLPAVCLDGELYMGRGMFQQLCGVVRRTIPDDADWQRVRFCVFDAPQASGGFEQRLAFAEKALAGCAVAQVVAHRKISGRAEADALMTQIIAGGGEGLMLRAPGSAYEGKRSGSLLKLKEFQSDEAEIIAHQPGEGQFMGQLGALLVRWKGKVFGLGAGLTHDLREDPPAIGLQVTFGFSGTTDGGTPRFPVFIAVRDYE